MKDWRQTFDKEEYWRLDGKNPDTGRPIFTRVNRELKEIIDQIISERDKEWEKWKVLAEAMDKALVGHRVTIKHLLGEDEWTLTRRNK